MKLSKDSNILIVGLGLLGGSYAKALKKKGYKVSAITKDQSSVDYAIENGIIDYGTTEVEKDLVAEADITIFALYPSVFLEWIETYGNLFKCGAVITDVTGVKSSIVYKIQSMLPDEVEFISAHPMAGREVQGVENSDDSIFHDANYIVCPSEENCAEAIELCKALGRELGFGNISVISAEEHDGMIAFLSQLTHCIAVSLMCSNDNENLVEYTGDSFRDLTRIARINENMWTELFMLNKRPLLKEMDRFLDTFLKLRESLQSGDTETMKEMMRTSTARRKLFDKEK